jgi:DNA-binding MarR family transcriptional regulator
MRSFYRASDYGMHNSVGYMVRRTSNMVLPQMEAMFGDADITFSQWMVLMTLREWGQSTAAEIARNICHDAGSLTRMIDQLEERGLITRLRSEADRRVVMLTPTPKGAALVESVLPQVVDFWNKLLGGFNQDEIKTLIKLLSRLTAAAAGEEIPKSRGWREHHSHRHHDHKHRDHKNEPALEHRPRRRREKQS